MGIPENPSDSFYKKGGLAQLFFGGWVVSRLTFRVFWTIGSFFGHHRWSPWMIWMDLSFCKRKEPNFWVPQLLTYSQFYWLDRCFWGTCHFLEGKPPFKPPFFHRLKKIIPVGKGFLPLNNPNTLQRIVGWSSQFKFGSLSPWYSP